MIKNILLYTLMGILMMLTCILLCIIIVGSCYILLTGTHIFSRVFDIGIRVILGIVWCGLIGYVFGGAINDD